MASRTKLRGNQINIRDVFNHPDAAATTERTGAVEIATQAEVLAGSPIGVVVTTDTLKNHPGLDELKDMYVTSGSPSDTLHSDKELFNLEVNASNVFTSEQIPDYGYDAASLAYASLTTTFSPPTSSNDMESIYIRPDGTYVYIVDRVSSPGIIREFPLSTPWDISSRGTNSANYTMSSGDHINAMQGIWFNDEGTKAIVSGQSDWAEYSFATPWDIANATFVQVITDLGESTGSTPLTFSKDGLHAYRTRRAFSANQWYVTEYQLGTAWNLSTISMVSDANEITSDMSVTNNATGCAINHDGTKLFVSYDNVTDTEVMEYSLSTPYTVSSRTLVTRANLTQSRFLAYPFWSQDGTDLYLLNDRVAYQYTSSAVDVGGLTTTLYHDGSERLGTRTSGVEVTGILELSGTNAQVALPKYATASLPTTQIKGGILFDTDTTTVKFYAGSPTGWVNTGLQNIIEDLSPQLGASLDVNDYDIVGAPAATATSNGGNINLIGAAGGATSGSGGNVTLTAGTATNGFGGSIGLTARPSTTSGSTGGSVSLNGGQGGPTAGIGGPINIIAGAGQGSGAGGLIAITAGNGISASGGDVNITSGDSTNSASGDIKLETGTALNNGGDIDLALGAGTVTGDVVIRSKHAATNFVPSIQLREATNNGSNYIGLKAPSSVAASQTWTLPLGSPVTAGDVLHTDGTGGLYFGAVSAGSVALNDLTDVVITDGGSPVNVMTDQVLTFSGTNWVNQSPVFRENNGNIIGGTGAFPNEGVYGGQSGNIVIGTNAAAGILSSFENVIIGNNASTRNTNQDLNVAVGARALRYAYTTHMTAIGAYAGEGVTGDTSANIHSQSVFVGNKAARYAYTADQCVIIGRSAGEGTSTTRFTGNNNTFLGFSAGKHSSYGNNNTFIGHSAGIGNPAGTAIQGHNNVAVGVNAFDGAEAIAVGNTVLGSQAGRNLVSGDQNVIIGYGAGPTTDETGKLYISNTSSATDSPLIFGDFTAGEVKINGELQTVAISETADTYGTSGAVALDTSAATYFYPTGATTGVITFSFTNPAGGSPIQRVSSFTLELWGGAGSPSPFVWPSSVKWPGGVEPTWTATAGSPIVNGYDVVSFVTRDGGTTWLGMLGGLAFK